MKEFIEKWKSDKLYQTKIKLLAYTLFVVLVGVFAVSTRQDPTNTQDTNNQNNEINQENTVNQNDTQTQTTKINIPSNYNYQIDIEINNNTYQYKGIKNPARETITKTTEDITTDYLYEFGSYYELINDELYETNKDSVYDIIDYNYLDLNTLNKYLAISKKISSNQYIISLKDIILGFEKDEYITITIINEENFNIDYTNLFNYFDKKIEKHLVKYNIKKNKEGE